METNILNNSELKTLLKLMAQYDICHQGYFDWTEELEFFASCNDIFFWGCSDSVEIENQKDIDLLKKSLDDCLAINNKDKEMGVLLYCARKRELRPQGAAYKFIPKELWGLFNACGEEREVDLGNPEEQPKN